jgi:hypothetical protein
MFNVHGLDGLVVMAIALAASASFYSLVAWTFLAIRDRSRSRDRP